MGPEGSHPAGPWTCAKTTDSGRRAGLGTGSLDSGRLNMLVTAGGGATWQEASVPTGYDFVRPVAVSLLDSRQGGCC